MTNYDETHAAIMHAIESLTEEQEVAYTAPDVPLPDEYVWTRTIFGRWSVIDKASKGVPYLDPAFERYWCM